MISHPCPGLCGAVVPYHRFACCDCWSRLPQQMRFAITDTWQRDPLAHAEAMSTASRWFRFHPLIRT